MDELDVKREAWKAAKDMMRRTGASSRAVRGMAKESVLEAYRIAVEYEGIPVGMQAAWLNGWRKQYGI